MDPGRIMQLGTGFGTSKALLSAVELGVFTELALQPADADGLGTNRKSQRRRSGAFDCGTSSVVLRRAFGGTRTDWTLGFCLWPMACAADRPTRQQRPHAQLG